MPRRLALVALALAAVLLPAGAAQAFAGRNGGIVYSWSSLDEPELGPPFHYERALRVAGRRDGGPATLRECQSNERGPVSGDCTISYGDPAVSPDGKTVAFDAGRSLAVIGMDGRGFRLLPAVGEDDGEPAFSAGGGRIAFSAGPSVSGPSAAARGIWVRDVARGTARRIVARGVHPVWSSRNWIAFVRAGQLWMVRPDGHGLRRLTRRGGTAPAWSPHGTKLAFSRRGSIYVLDLATGRLRRAVRRADAVDLAWSPDGRRFAVSTFDGTLSTIGANGRGARQLVAGGSGATYNLSASAPDWQPLR